MTKPLNKSRRVDAFVDGLKDMTPEEVEAIRRLIIESSYSFSSSKEDISPFNLSRDAQISAVNYSVSTVKVESVLGSSGSGDLDRETYDIVQSILEAIFTGCSDSNARLALIYRAFPDKANLRTAIDYNGSQSAFIGKLIHQLCGFGTYLPNVSALWHLMDALKDNVGINWQAKIDYIEPILNKTSEATVLRNSPEHVSLTTSTNLDLPQSLEIESKVKSQLDIAVALYKSGRFSASSEIILQVRDDYWNRVSLKTRGRIANNQGCVANAFNCFDEALRFFEEAYAFDPQNVDYVLNIAQVHQSKENTEEALRFTIIAKDIAAENEKVVALYIQALYLSGRAVEAEEFANQSQNTWIKTSYLYSGVRAVWFMQQEKHEQAIPLLRETIKRTPISEKDGHFLMLLGIALYAYVISKRKRQMVDYSSSSDLDKKLLEEAEESYTKAAKIYEEHESRTSFHNVLLNRAATRIAQNQHEEALSDCERILEQSTNHKNARLQKAYVLMEMKRYSEAISMYKSILFDADYDSSLEISSVENPAHEESFDKGFQEALLLLGTCLVEVEQYEEVIDTLKFDDSEIKR